MFGIFLRLCALSIWSASFLFCATEPPDYPLSRGPAKLTFEDLLRLAVADPLPPDVADRLQHLLTEPFIGNQATFSGVTPRRPNDAKAGPLLRVAEWNIERGLNESEVELSLSRDERFEERASIEERSSSQDRSRLRRALLTLRDADIVILDEVDLGMKRTKYVDVTRSLAKALHFNYVYGVEFIELERLYLGEKKLDLIANSRDHDPKELFGVDPRRYEGLEGATVLSRYPIRNARILRLPECYDWFHGEMKQISDLEKLRRWSAERIFEESIRRQVRRGGRMALIVDIEIPEALNRQVTVIAPHLENYCSPNCRKRQMDFLLDHVRTISNPVILGGDLNTTGHDGTPTSVRHEVLKRIRDYRFWARQAVFWFIPVPFAGVIAAPINYFKNHHDPTAFNLPLLLPNREKGLFKDAREFRFADGGKFDFMGREEKAVAHKGRTLSQSDQRKWKGFDPTFFFRKRYFHLVGSYKLDWFMVKLGESEPGDLQARPFTPRFGRTLTDVNTALGTRISDHCPITIDLPLTPQAQDRFRP
jgi:endonuclease/exonuclease/phosphatase family metal-dependent hydrolase